MQSTLSNRRSLYRSAFALGCMLAVLVMSGVQVAHWDAQRDTQDVSAQSAQASDGLCPICYSVPVGHGAAPASLLPVRIEGTQRVALRARQRAGIQPEFHLHIRPPPIVA